MGTRFSSAPGNRTDTFGGREVELQTYEDLSRFIRDEVSACAEALDVAACRRTLFDVNLDVLWSTVTVDLPKLLEHLPKEP